MKKARNILLPLLMLLASVSVFSKPQSYSLPDDAMEGMFSMQYRQLINTQIICVINNDSIYVPVKEIFSRLMIYYTFDSDKQILEGYYISKDNTFKLDFNFLTAQVGDKGFTLRDEEFLRDDLEIFILPSTLRRLFNMNLTADFSDLMLVISDNAEDVLSHNLDNMLPIMQKYNRSRQHDRLSDGDLGSNPFPLLFDRDLHLLNGGMMGVELNYGMNSVQRSFSYGTSLGAEFLGGDLNANLYGVFNNNFNFQNFLFKNFLNWRFYFGDNPFVTNFRIGNIPTGVSRLNVVNSFNITGASISNAPINYATLYNDKYVLEDDLPVGWQVELYINSVLVDFKSSTANFRKYRFVFPLYYGRTHIELRFFGPKGETYTENKTLNIPYYIIPPGEANYSFAAGYRDFNNFNSIYQPRIYDGKFGLGITRWMSLYGGYTKFEDGTDPLVMAKLLLVPLSNVEMIVTADPNLYLSVMTFLNFEQAGNYVVNYSNYRILNQFFPKEQQGGILYTTDFIANPPLFEFVLPIQFNMRWSRRQFEMGPGMLASSNNVASRFGVLLENFRFVVNYSLGFMETNFNVTNIQHTLSPSLTWVWFEKPDALDFLKTTSLTAGGFYDITWEQLRTVYLGLTQGFGTNINLGARVDRDLRSNTTRVNIGFTMNLDRLRSNTNAIFFEGDYQFNQNLGFGLAYDSFSNDFFVENLYTSGLDAGTGGVVLRFFLDDNSDQVYNEGEQIVPDVQAQINGGRRVFDETTRISRYVGLRQYGTYQVRIDKDAFTNPLWVAGFPSFSFMVDPNQMKTIDIPCYSTGVVEGAVSHVDEGKTTAQAGVKVHIMKIDSSYEETLPVFSDGTFYKAGVPPGEYRAWVDSAQIAILNVKSVPELIAFNVAKTTYGDFVEGLNFELYTQEAFLAKADNGNSLRKVDDSRLHNGNQADSSLSVGTNSADAPEADTPAPSGADIPSAADAPAAAIALGAGTDTPDDGLKLADTKAPTADEKAAALLAVPAAKPNTQSSIQIITNETKLFSYKNSKDFKLTGQMTAYLDAVAEFMTNNPRCELSIVAHTDNFGSMKETQDISDKRATAVVAYLAAKGIPEGRLLARGEGSRAPIASNLTDSGRLQNRRIEIMVIE